MSELRMPAEWAPHEMTLVAWPQREEAWRGTTIEEARDSHAEVVAAISEFEPVLLVVDPSQAADARGRVPERERGIFLKRRSTTPGCVTPGRSSSRARTVTGPGWISSSTPGARLSLPTGMTRRSRAASSTTSTSSDSSSRWSSRADRSPSTAKACWSPPSSACSIRTATRTSTGTRSTLGTFRDPGRRADRLAGAGPGRRRRHRRPCRQHLRLRGSRPRTAPDRSGR